MTGIGSSRMGSGGSGGGIGSRRGKSAGEAFAVAGLWYNGDRFWAGMRNMAGVGIGSLLADGGGDGSAEDGCGPESGANPSRRTESMTPRGQSDV
jgi:hypothetical protein